MLPKKYRLPKHAVLSLIKTGRKLSSPQLFCKYSFSGGKNSHVAIIVKSKPSITSVERVQIKRIVRKIVVAHLDKLNPSCNVVFVVQGKGVNYSTLQDEIINVFRSISTKI